MEAKNIKLNFLDKFYMPYDWLNTDKIINYSKMSIYRITSKALNEFINYKIRILDETIFKNNNPALFSDTYNYIAIIFNKNGYSISKSSLLLEDEFKLNQNIDDLKVSKVIYNRLDLEKKDNDLRINTEMRKTIEIELDKLQKENNLEKLTYLYYEWFNKKENDLQKMLTDMHNKILMPLSNNEKNIYEIIKKSYKLV